METHRPSSIATDGRYVQIADRPIIGRVSDVLDDIVTDRATGLWHLDGVPWWDASIPGRWHRHWIQSVGWTDDWTGGGKAELHRCACGAIRTLDGPYSGWMGRNERRRSPSATQSCNDQ